MTERILEKIETQINNIAQNYSNISMRVIEQPLFPDLHMGGIERFSRRIGSGAVLPFLEPQNRVITTEAISQSDEVLPVQVGERTFKTNWFTNYSVPGANGRLLRCVVQVDNEYHKLEQLDVIDSELTLESGDGLINNYVTGTSVDLYGVPVRIRLFKDDGVTKIEIICNYPIMNNDIILLGLSSTVISFNEYKVLTCVRKSPTSISTCIPITGTTEYRHIITIEDQDDFISRISNDISEIEILAGVEILNHLFYVKGYGAFESWEVFSPKVQGKEQPGPFALDHMSGQLYAFKTPVKDFLNVKVRTSGGTYLFGSNTTFETISKNTSVPNCITNDKIVLWDKVHGHCTYDNKTGLLYLIPDENGEICFKVDLEPAIRIPAQWTFKIFADIREASNIDMQLQLYPNKETNYSIPYRSHGYSIATEAVGIDTSIKGIIEFHQITPSAIGYAEGTIIAVNVKLKKLVGGVWTNYAVTVNDKYIVKSGSTGTYSVNVNNVATWLLLGSSGFWNLSISLYGSVYYNLSDSKYYSFNIVSDVEGWYESTSGFSVSKIIMSIKAQYTVKISPWVLIGSQVRKIQYQLLAHTFGANWQSSSIIVKPLLKSIINLTGTYNNARYNNGYIYSASRS